jgi:SprT protein
MKLPFALPKRLKTLLTPTSPTVRKKGALKGEPAHDLTLRAQQKLAELGLHSLAAPLQVLWNARMRSTAGLAYPSLTQIVLNPRLREFGEREVERTLFHELAHLVAQHRAGRRKIAPHGIEWQKACSDLGLQNETRCHDLPLPRRQITRKYLYQCPHCHTQLPRARPFRRPAACLPCCRTFGSGTYEERFRLQRVHSSSPS